MTLFQQVVVLLIGAGGAIATAITLSNNLWRRVLVVCFSVLGAVGLVLTILTYFEIDAGALLNLAKAIISSFLTYVVWIKRLPGFWVVVAFFGGAATVRWVVPWITRRVKSANEMIVSQVQVKEWLTPHQAFERFGDPSLISKSRKAAAKIDELRQSAVSLESKIQRAKDDTEKQNLRTRLDELLEECKGTEYLAAHRRTDAMADFYKQLQRGGRLIAKGNKVKNGKVKANETYMPDHLWKIIQTDYTNLNFETGEYYLGFLGDHYRNVLIGERVQRDEG